MVSTRIVVLLLAVAFVADAKIKRDAPPPPSPPSAAEADTNPADPMNNLLGATKQAVAMVIGTAADSVGSLLTQFQAFLINFGVKPQADGTPLGSFFGIAHAFLGNGINLMKDIKAANPVPAQSVAGGAQH
ncbi:hypothetical protein PRIPAC_80838 [Pristionchus pacificus]|uniref:Uncharacterized protein n=1 Tax=Pristionchus pacificus TaxID=54126 RepID=A0A2A6CQ50_PRIPA|nr:hypothetical protein PRIPAC_80838 [Pristionchus pacificus]|eukprot:PDM80250.1 hypothetical protein PRIPAC_32829 [Pristionchus pacificus]